MRLARPPHTRVLVSGCGIFLQHLIAKKTHGIVPHDLQHRRNVASVNMRGLGMQQQISAITLGVSDLARAKRFYQGGFGWASVFENEEIAFYQMNGFVLGTFLKPSFAQDMKRPAFQPDGAYALAHNVLEKVDVVPGMDKLISAGGSLLRAADAPPHGGFRGYVADPDGHAWEIAWNPSWPIDANGYVTFGV